MSEREKALEDFEQFLRFIDNIGAPYHPNDFLRQSTIKAIRQALAPVNVDALKKKKINPQFSFYEPGEEAAMKAWNACIDHLVKTGVL